MGGLGALIELKSLPSKNEKIWPYGGLYIGFLRSRSVYESFIFEKRVSDIKEMVNRFKPRLVVFNGKNKNDKIVSYWERIAGTKFHKHEDLDLLIGNNDQTIFIISKQMASGQITNQQLFNIGLYAASGVLLPDSRDALGMKFGLQMFTNRNIQTSFICLKGAYIL